tara:strand:+ start:463 stop:1380 length:918 start_codon:yes stop_codon:yes gene_type:complete
MKTDLREDINNRLINAIEAGTLPWRKPWICDPNAGTPVNVDSQKRYRGINTWLVDLTAIEKGFQSRWWGTYKQWQERGCQVRKGEKGTRIVFYSFVSQKNESEESNETEEGEAGGYCFLKQYTVFNAEQVDGDKIDRWRVSANPGDYVQEWDDEPLAEAVAQATGAEINVGGESAYYDFNTDAVTIPEKSRFDAAADYYSVLFHELSHWTERRIGFTSEDLKKRVYAVGELFAEIAGCYVCNDLRIPNRIDDSAAYLESWLERLKADKQLIFTISKWSNKAADFILGGELGETVESVDHRQFHQV